MLKRMVLEFPGSPPFLSCILFFATLAPAADWVVDRCAFTYRGKPVPLGRGLAEFTELFGAPSDSHITPRAKGKAIKTYFWDRIGMRTRYFSDAKPELFGGVEISFQEPVQRFGRKNRPWARGKSTLEFKPFGQIDERTILKVLQEGFVPGHARGAREDDYLELDLGRDSRLSLLFLKDDNGKHFGLSLRYAAPDDTPYPNYATAQAKMGVSCKLP